jgi:hypothetical protein
MPRRKNQESSRRGIREPQCGKAVGRLCSDLFKARYDIDRIRTLVLKFSGQYQFHEFFEDLPRDRENPNLFDSKAFRDYATGLWEHVYEELKKRENDPDYKVYVLNSVVFKIIKGFLTQASKDQQEIHELKVNEKRIKEIRWRLMRPDITLEDLVLLSVRPVPEQAWDLYEELKNCPGYRHVWFKIKRQKKKDILFLYKTGKDVEEEYEFLTRPRRDAGHRRR